MAIKQFDLEGIGPINVYKRRGTKQLRLSVDHAGKVRLSMPTWLPYKAGLSYVVSKKAWLLTQLDSQMPNLHTNGDKVGKQHSLYFEETTSQDIRISVKNEQAIVSFPQNLRVESSQVQAAATKASLRALRKEAEQHLPQRLQDLAQLHGLNFRSVSIRQLKSRWGSCDQNTDIKLNLYLMQLPWEVIDYVLLHELVHTKVMQHGPVFWQAMTELQPETPRLRKEIKAYKTTILH